MHVCTRTRAHKYTYTRTQVHAHVHVQVHEHTHKHAEVHIHAHIQSNACMRAHANLFQVIQNNTNFEDHIAFCGTQELSRPFWRPSIRRTGDKLVSKEGCTLLTAGNPLTKILQYYSAFLHDSDINKLTIFCWRKYHKP